MRAARPVVDPADWGRPKPRLRGWLHLVVAFLAVPAAIALVVHASTGQRRIGAVVYGVTLLGLYWVSAVYHRGRWSLEAKRRMRVADHSTIYVFIAGTYTPMVLSVVHGWQAWVTGVAVWVAAAVGVGTTVWERGRDNGVNWRMILYLAIGWVAVGSVPQLVHTMSPVAFGMLVAGGLLYTAGAILFAMQKPDPMPEMFGYHEVWHCFVVCACACQFAMLWLVVA
jgi:hemolysin III